MQCYINPGMNSYIKTKKNPKTVVCKSTYTYDKELRDAALQRLHHSSSSQTFLPFFQVSGEFQVSTRLPGKAVACLGFSAAPAVDVGSLTHRQRCEVQLFLNTRNTQRQIHPYSAVVAAAARPIVRPSHQARIPTHLLT